MRNVAITLVAVLVIVSTGAAKANEATRMLLQFPDKVRNLALTDILEKSGKSCAVTENFLQGLLPGGEAVWNVRCANGNTLAIMIKNDAVGSTTILECSVMTLTTKIKCFTKFKEESAKAPVEQNKQASCSARDDSEKIVCLFGEPDFKDTTAYAHPRPSFPTLLMDYRREGVRFTFVPGDNAKPGDPPPYRWTLIAFQDLQSNDVLTRSKVRQRMETRRKRPGELPNAKHIK